MEWPGLLGLGVLVWVCVKVPSMHVACVSTPLYRCIASVMMVQNWRLRVWQSLFTRCIATVSESNGPRMCHSHALLVYLRIDCLRAGFDGLDCFD